MNRFTFVLCLIIVVAVTSPSEGRRGSTGGGPRSSGRSGGRSTQTTFGRSSGGTEGRSAGRNGVRSEATNTARSFGRRSVRSEGTNTGRSFGRSGIRSEGTSTGRSFGRSSVRSEGTSTGRSGGRGNRRRSDTGTGRSGRVRGRGSSSRRHSSGISGSRYSRGLTKTTKWKSPSSFSSSAKKTMKKAGLVGVGAYTGYKLAKVSSKFKKHRFKTRGYGRWNSDDWARAASLDKSFLCRTNSDCIWLDDDLECHTTHLTFSPSTLWFGGDVSPIRGKCQCQDNFWWDHDDLLCQMFLEEEGGRADGGAEALPWWADVILSIGFVICMCICYGFCTSKA